MPSDMTTGELLARAAATWPGAVAVADNGRVVTFAQLHARVRKTAGGFVARDLAAGERIAIWAPNALEWIEVALAAELVGLVLVPLNTRYKGREAGDILRRSGARLLFATREFLGLDLAGMVAEEDLPQLDAIIAIDPDSDELAAFREGGRAIADADIDARADAVRPDDIVDILYTSGTTGLPKGVMCTHDQNIRSFTAWADAVGLTADDRYLIVNPFFHSFGYKAGWLACLITGASAYPVPMFDAGTILETIAAEAITVMPGPPTLYQSLLDHPDLAAHDIASLRLAVTGAASVPPSLIGRMRDELGIEDVLTAYGLTEATGVVTATHPDDPADLIAVSCGVPIPGVEIRLVDAGGKDVASGAPGELLVRGFNVMRGYLDDPEATAAAIDADGWLHTGDIAVQDENGYLRITDRVKDMIITGGFNVYPAEIEAMLIDHPDVMRAAVVGQSDERLGEVAQAWLVLREGARLDEAAMTQWCRETMANFKVPRSFRVIDELPMNASGKVQRYVLKDRA